MPPSDSTKANQTPVRAAWHLDVKAAIPLDGQFSLAASVIAPADLNPGQPVTVLACLPGGFLSRHYFDLEIQGSRTYSFAAAMAALGYVVLSFDHVGTGDSPKPSPTDEGYALGVEVIAAANQLALDAALDRLTNGSADDDLPPIEVDRTIGVGHSMGSMLTVEQQALAHPHDALALFSFSTQGTPRFIDDEMRAYANDPHRLRSEIGALAKATMGSPYPERATDSESNRRAAFGVGTAGDEAEDALHQAATNLLAVGGLMSMVPGGFAPPAQKIDVPVFMLVGDHDLHDDRHTRDELPNAPSVTTSILPDCWHCHFVANTRETLVREVHAFIQGLGD